MCYCTPGIHTRKVSDPVAVFNSGSPSSASVAFPSRTAGPADNAELMSEIETTSKSPDGLYINLKAIKEERND